VRLFFSITQHFRDEELIRSLVDYLGCGNIYITKKSVEYKISKIKDLTDKILPFFYKYNILGIKSLYYKDFKKIAFLIKNGDHLTAEGLNQICKIKTGMNRGRSM
jgi:hypothetical protein